MAEPRRWAAPFLAGLFLALAPAPALAHGEEPHLVPGEPAPGEAAPGPRMDHGARREPVTLELRVRGDASLGEVVRLEATLLDDEGMPVPEAPIEFSQEATFADVAGEAPLGLAWTDERGVASVRVQLRTAGHASFAARFPGDDAHRPAEASSVLEVAGDRQLYEPEVGLRVPGVGVWWLLVLVGAVWGLYLLVARQVVGIARAGSTAPGEAEGIGRRRFLTSFLVPAGLVAGIASLGSGLLALISRSPRTHWNLARDPTSHLHARHRLTPVAYVGEAHHTVVLPPILEREVSFSREVLPILLEKGGPHTHPSAYSPPPHGVRLDSYAAIMGLEEAPHGEEEPHAEKEPHAEEGAHGEEEPHAEEAGHGHRLVVPGKPEESMLVRVLVDHAHRMPPAVPLSEEEIQLIASWVAQGAKDN
ncbi:MAG TPA: hypothetical protein VNO79_17360 [Actinomycetota bacterium]|nr:hypothetical protein [Actinomycetota bacterium]